MAKKIKQMLSNNLRLNFGCLKVVHILHLPYHPEIKGYILKIKQNSKSVCIHVCMYAFMISHCENEDENEK